MQRLQQHIRPSPVLEAPAAIGHNGAVPAVGQSRLEHSLTVEGHRSAAISVSVIVPHYQDLNGLALCLSALEQQTYPREAFEIIVADNASPVGTQALETVIAGRARLEVVRDRGAGPARNGGATVARGEMLAFTDSDCRPEPDWLAAGLKRLAGCDFVGGEMRVLVEDREQMTAAEAFETVFAFDNANYVQNKGFTVTANLFTSRRVFEAVGGFRTGVSEDLDWSHRARDAGFRIGYAPDAVVGHPARRSWADLKTKWGRLNAETYQLYRDRPGGRLRWLARSLILPLSALAHTPRVLATRRLRGIRTRLSALGMLYRQRLWRCGDALGLLAGRAGR